MLRSRASLGFAVVAAIGFAFGCTAEGPDEEGEASYAAVSLKRLTPADVSILLPLPKVTADESMAVTEKGKGGGELIPDSAYVISPAAGRPTLLDQLFYGSHGEPAMTPAKERKALRLTAVRLDPCGRVAPTDPESSCVPEVRLVFQPVLKSDGKRTDGKKIFEAADGAVHAFYRVSNAELTSFAKAMFDARNVRGDFSYTSLGVHPTLDKEGLTGDFAKALFAQVRRVAGAANLERVTFLQRTPAREPVWVFGITSVTKGVASPETIASTSSKLQAIEGPGLGSPMHFTDLSGKGGKPTETSSPDKVSAILNTRDSTEAQQIKALNATVRIDNPMLHSPSTMACVECHVASGARKALLNAKPAMKARIDGANVFSPPMTASHVASKDVGNLHSFSWKGTDIGVSDRTANESAQVATKLNAILF